jgi:ABC-2 type transport system permease protein
MRRALLIAARDYNAAVRTKGFIIGLVLLPFLLGGGIVIIKLMEGRVDTRDRRIAVIDRTGVVAPALVEAAERRNESDIYDQETGRKVRPAYIFEIVEPAEADIETQRLELSNRVRAAEIFAFVEIGPDVLYPGEDAEAASINYHSENPVFDNVRNWMISPINDRVRSLRVAEADLDEDIVNRLTRWMPIEGLGLITVDEDTGEVQGAESRNEWQTIGAPYGLVMLMFMLIMVTVNPLVHSTLEEKMHRIAEVLLGSARPSQLMAGKLLAAIGVSLTMVTIYIVAGSIAARYLNISESIPYHLLPWFIVYGISALFMFGALFLAVGSACNDLKESQSMMMPLWLFLVLPMFVWFPVMREPTSSFATWASLFPPCTPILMLVRMASPVSIPSWQPWAGLAGIVLFTIAAVWAAGRIYRVGILMYGKPPRLTEILRWALRG